MKAASIDSLDAAVDRLNEAQFYGSALPRAEQDRLVRNIAARQGKPGAYAGGFALTPAEKANGIRVFTGEHMTSASARHIIGEECCRVLLTLKGSPDARNAAKAAANAMLPRIIEVADANGHPGLFCCGKCSVSLWRHLSADGFNGQEARLGDGMKRLRKRRDGEGGWTRFPFHYTLLALTEIEPDLAKAEIKYAASIIRRKLARRPGSSRYAKRRHDVMARALERL